MIAFWRRQRAKWGSKEPRHGVRAAYAQPRVEWLEDRTLLSFNPAVNYHAGTSPHGVAIADFNKDGKRDVVVANFGSRNVSVLLGNGDGTLQPAVNYDVGFGPTAVAVGDFNRDGKPDIVVANQDSNTVSVLLGNGDGTFQAAVNYEVGFSPSALAVGDFIGDGKLDLVVANQSSNTVSVLLGNGDGTFKPAVSYVVGGSPSAVAIGNLAGSTKPDIVTANQADNTVSVLINNGDGTFKPAVAYDAGAGPSAVTVGDFNRDGSLDLAVADFKSASVSILLNNGDGTFRAPASFPVGAGPSAVLTSDLDGDGPMDLLVTNQNSDNVSVMEGNPDGTFGAAVNYATGKGPVAMALGDLTGHIAPDLVVANSGKDSDDISVLINQPEILTFLVSGPSESGAGNDFNFTVTARDAFGNAGTGYTGIVHFTSSDGQGVLPRNYTFTSADKGVHTFTAQLKTTGLQSLTATDTTTTSITGSLGIRVRAAAATSFLLTGFPSTTTAGLAQDFTVSARDVFGNIATGYLGMVKFSSDSSQADLPNNYTFAAGDAGTRSFRATLKTAGVHSLTVTDTTNNALTGQRTGILVNPGAASVFLVAGFTTPATAGETHSFTVTVRDDFGNTVTNYNGKIALSSSDSQAVLPDPYTFVGSDAGAHTFSAAFRTAGTQSLTATDSSVDSLTGTQANITVNSAAASNFLLSGFTGITVAGVPQNFTVSTRDAFGNAVPGYTGTVRFSSSDPLAVLPANYAFTSADKGTHSFSVTFRTAGAQAQTLTVTDVAAPGVNGSQMFVITSAKAARLELSPSTSGVVGQSISVTVKVFDVLNNLATSYTGTAHFTSSDNAATLPDDYTFTSSDSGVHTFTLTPGTAGNQTLTATATDTAAGSIAGSGTVAVGQAGTSTVITSNGTPVNLGEGATFLATVSIVAPGAGTPKGTVIFKDNGTAIGTASLQSDGTASFSTSSLPPGKRPITAVYNGDGNFSGSTSSSVTQVVGTPVQRYVAQIYLDLLHRPVDAAGLDAWTNVLNQGVPPSVVVSAMENSPEYRVNVVQSLYGQYLGRTADVGGLNGFVAFLEAGGTVEQAASILASSPEYFQRRGGGSNDGFLAAFYQDAFKRLIDASGRAAFNQFLANGGTRQQVTAAIFSSTEYVQDLTRGFYQQFLRRAADSGGLNGFVNALQHGTRDQDAIAVIVGSDEYLASV